jgi:UDP-3-O-[3-hydroxymyristoyl] N-acetylglucosamine deacetylase
MTRTTIARSVTAEGIGLHLGEAVTVSLHPAPPETGFVFIRTDRGGTRIPARAAALSTAAYATLLAVDGATVSTVEHLLSAAYALGIDDLRIELAGGEVPILDGSALPFVRLLEEAGRATSAAPRRAIRIDQPLSVEEEGKSITVSPCDELRVRYSIDFPDCLIGRSDLELAVTPEAYVSEIAPARTFCRLDEVQALHAVGLARGGSLANALLVDRSELLNPPLRFPDEFVRHKILDLIGDLSLLGHPLLGRVEVVRGGHALHGLLVRALLATPKAWSLVPIGEGSTRRSPSAPVAVPA